MAVRYCAAVIIAFNLVSVLFLYAHPVPQKDYSRLKHSVAELQQQVLELQVKIDARQAVVEQPRAKCTTIVKPNTRK